LTDGKYHSTEGRAGRTTDGIRARCRRGRLPVAFRLWQWRGGQPSAPTAAGAAWRGGQPAIVKTVKNIEKTAAAWLKRRMVVIGENQAKIASNIGWRRTAGLSWPKMRL